MVADDLERLVIQDIFPGEVMTDLAWQGTPTHLRAVAEAVERAQSGAVDYLVARLAGVVVGSGGVDSAPDPTGESDGIVRTHSTECLVMRHNLLPNRM